MRSLLLVAIIGATITVALGSLDQLAANINEDTEEFNKIIVDPLDPEFYGLEGEDDDDDTELMGDIEDEIEGILEQMEAEEEEEIIEEVLEEVDDDDDDNDDDDDDDNDDARGNGRGNRKRQNRKSKQMWKQFGRKSSKHVSRFMRRKNITDVQEVPARKFKGRLGRVHKKMRKEEGVSMAKGPMRRLYRKVTKKANKHLQNGGTTGRINKLCKNLVNRSSPRPKVLAKVPETMKEGFLEMFEMRRQQLAECCRIEEDMRPMCLLNAHFERLDNNCRMSSRMPNQSQQPGNMFKKWQRQAECCEITESEERHGCFKDINKAIRAEKHAKLRRKNSPSVKFNRTCTKLGKPMRGPWFKKLFSRLNETETQRWKNIFQERRNQMKQCCQKPQGLNMECANAIKTGRFDRVCAGEEDFKPEPFYNPQKHGLLVNTCCQRQGNERYQCFGKKGRNLRPASVRYNAEGQMIPPVRPNRHGDIVIAMEVVEDIVEEGVAPEDVMLGDDPMVASQRQKRKVGRKTAKPGAFDRQTWRQVRRECCEAGQEKGQQLPSDAESLATRQQECESGSQEHSRDVGRADRVCGRVYMRCCERTQAQRAKAKANRKEKRKEKRKEETKEQRQERKERRQERRQERRKVSIDVAVEGDPQDVEEVIEDIEDLLDKEM